MSPSGFEMRLVSWNPVSLSVYARFFIYSTSFFLSMVTKALMTEVWLRARR